jgi:hypothetical protein
VAALQREFDEKGLAMIGVDLGDDLPDIESFRERYGTGLPIAVEDQDRAKKTFGILGCPSTVLINRKGQMVGRTSGEGDWAGESARALVRSLLGIPGATEAAAPWAKPKQARKSVHLVSAVMPNDLRLNDILNEAAAALKAGDEVAILFDGQSVGALRTSAQKTPLEGAEFTSNERTAIAKRLGIAASAAPRNQLEYIQRLASAGAKVMVNANAVRAFGLADAEIHSIAKRVSVGEMEKVVDESDACYTYSHD